MAAFQSLSSSQGDTLVRGLGVSHDMLGWNFAGPGNIVMFGQNPRPGLRCFSTTLTTLLRNRESAQDGRGTCWPTLHLRLHLCLHLHLHLQRRGWVSPRGGEIRRPSNVTLVQLQYMPDLDALHTRVSTGQRAVWVHQPAHYSEARHRPIQPSNRGSAGHTPYSRRCQWQRPPSPTSLPPQSRA